MAGTLLLIKKDKVSTDSFQNLKDKLKKKVEVVFAEHFPMINYRETDQNSFLVEFRKNTEEKFYGDTNGNWLTFEGTVFALKETKALSAESLLKLYLKSPEKFPNSLDGHFVIKIFDSIRNEYLIINDFIKNKTNFLCETKDYILFTPFVLTTTIIKKPELDLEAFNEFMWRYYILSERSILKGVQRLAPASKYMVNDGSLSQEKYWEWPKEYSKISFREAVASMQKSMKETARLISDKYGTPCIDFTMGQDSRQVISSFLNQDLEITTTTFGKPNFYEVKKIKEIAKSFNIENKTIELEEDYTDNLWPHFKKSILLGSCEEPGYLLGRIMYMREQQAKLAKVSLNGMDGHFYKNGLWDEMYTFNFYREPKAFNVNSFLKLRALSSKYPDTIFSEEFKKVKEKSTVYFKEIVDRSISNYLKSPVSMQVDRFDLYHWLNFTTVSNNTGNLTHNSISPLLLRRNLELAIKLPVKWKFNLSKFQRAVVYGMHKSFARVRTDFAGVNMVPKNILTIIPFYIRYFYFQSARLRNKIKSKLGFQVTSHLHEAWDYLPLYKNLLGEIKQMQLLDYENMHLASIIKEEEWNAFLRKYRNTDELRMNEYEFLFKLVSIEIILNETGKWSNIV